MASYSDINSIITTQQRLITDFSGSMTNTTAQSVVAAVNNNLSNMQTSLDAANGSIRTTLTDQQEVQQILDRERDRLDERQMAIEAAYEGQQRMVTLSSSLSEKQKAYNYMIIVIVLMMLVYVGIKMLKSFAFVPDFILDIILIAVLAAGIIYCFYLYVDIRRRSNMDFNQITLAKPVEKSVDEINKEKKDAIKAGDLMKLSSGSSCPWGTTYNEKYKVCIPDAPTGTTKIVIADATKSPVTFSWSDPCPAEKTYDNKTLTCINANVNGFANMDVVQPNSAFEYNNYAFYQ